MTFPRSAAITRNARSRRLRRASRLRRSSDSKNPEEGAARSADAVLSFRFLPSRSLGRLRASRSRESRGPYSRRRGLRPEALRGRTGPPTKTARPRGGLLGQGRTGGLPSARRRAGAPRPRVPARRGAHVRPAWSDSANPCASRRAMSRVPEGCREWHRAYSSLNPQKGKSSMYSPTLPGLFSLLATSHSVLLRSCVLRGSSRFQLG